MKWKPVLCVSVLAFAAGCAQQNPYATFGEYGFSYDLVQAPIPGLTVAENDRIARMPSASPTQLLNPPVVIVAPPPVVVAPVTPTVDVATPAPAAAPVAAPPDATTGPATPAPTPVPATPPQ